MRDAFDATVCRWLHGSRRFRVIVLLLLATAVTEATPAVDEQVLMSTLVRQTASYVVQVETVGGVQPLARLPEGPRQQGVDEGEDEENEEDTPRRERSRFRDDPGSGFLLADGPTTGIVYSSDGLILTSSFNFVREPSVVTVRLSDGRQIPATIVARDKVRKLALLKVEASGLTPPRWTPREEIRPGQWAVALGRGFGGVTTVSAGVVSGRNRMAGNAIQTDAKLSPANYGGPLVDSAGRVLGICVPMALRPGELAGIELYDAGVGFAIPGWRVDEIVAELRTGKNFYRGWLGMVVDQSATKSVKIQQTADPSPLRSAGALPGDVITAINGKPIKHFGQLVHALYMIPAGEAVTVSLLRGADTLDVVVVLAPGNALGDLPPVEEPVDPTLPQP